MYLPSGEMSCGCEVIEARSLAIFSDGAALELRANVDSRALLQPGGAPPDGPRYLEWNFQVQLARAHPDERRSGVERRSIPEGAR